MRTDRETTRIVRTWLEEGVTTLPDRVLDNVLDQLPATHQRRSWWPPQRFFHLTRLMQTATAAAAVLVAVILGFSLLPGAPGIGRQPTPTPPPTPILTSTPSPSPSTLPTDGDSDLSPGSYSLSGFPVGISFEVPAGWVGCSVSFVEQGVCHQSTEPPTALAFLIVDNVVADPCSPGEEGLDPPVGPSVDDLVTAISGLDGFEATAPLDVSIDGHPGKEFTVTAPNDATCALKTWATSNRTNGVAAGEVNILQILDVNGTRVMISGAYHPGAAAAAEELAALQQVMASVRIQP
jgi:hypothetical protein